MLAMLYAGEQLRPSRGRPATHSTPYAIDHLIERFQATWIFESQPGLPDQCANTVEIDVGEMENQQTLDIGTISIPPRGRL